MHQFKTSGDVHKSRIWYNFVNSLEGRKDRTRVTIFKVKKIELDSVNYEYRDLVSRIKINKYSDKTKNLLSK